MPLPDPTISTRPPSLASELRRGIHPFNLGVALVCALIVGGLSLTTWIAPLWASLIGLSIAANAAIVAAVMFLIVTVLHTAGHAYFGWRFGRGIAAEQRGDYTTAERLLSAAGKPSMIHFDPHQLAAAALERCRMKRAADAGKL